MSQPPGGVGDLGGARDALAATFKAEWGRIVATLIRTTGDWELAEECAQDAVAQALASWPRDGVPQRPGAWLTTVARRRAIDRLRRRATEGARLAEAALIERASLEAGAGSETAGGVDRGAIEDDRLRLIFTCCHPALPLEGRVALTLRSLAGLSTAEIARAFLVPEATMAKRLVRAKQKIQRAAIPYRVPPPELRAPRLSGVLAVLYLLFNEGYAASSGDELLRVDLCDEAIRLAGALCTLMPDEPEVAGLLALMRLQHARRRARVDHQGELVTLEEQDRRLWDHIEIEAASADLEAALAAGRLGPYQLQATIAALHASAGQASQTDWPAIARCYRKLAQLQPSPVVELNRAVAVAMAEGARAGLAIVDALALEGSLGAYYLLHATRADLLRRLGRTEEAASSYRRALALTAGAAERRFLERRLAELAGGERSPA